MPKVFRVMLYLSYSKKLKKLTASIDKESKENYYDSQGIKNKM